MTNIIDLKSGKDVKDLEREDEEYEEVIQESFRKNVQEALDNIQKLLNEGTLSGIVLSGITQDEFVTPLLYSKYSYDMYRLEFITKEMTDCVHETMAIETGLRSFEE